MSASQPDLRDKIAAVLNREGAFCGQCSREPGDAIDDCPECRRCIDRYTEALLPIVAAS